MKPTDEEPLLAALASPDKAALVDALLRGDRAQTWSILVAWCKASGCVDAQTVLLALVRHLMRLVVEGDALSGISDESNELLEHVGVDYLELLARELVITAYAPRPSSSVN